VCRAISRFLNPSPLQAQLTRRLVRRSPQVRSSSCPPLPLVGIVERMMNRSLSTPGASTSELHHRSPYHNNSLLSHEEGLSHRFLQTNRSSSDELFEPSPTPSPSPLSLSHPLSSPHHHSTRDLGFSPPPSTAASSLPCSPPFEDPDQTPNYRRAYRIEHSSGHEEDHLSREEVVKLMQDLEKVSCSSLTVSHSPPSPLWPSEDTKRIRCQSLRVSQSSEALRGGDRATERPTTSLLDPSPTADRREVSSQGQVVVAMW
jgi:hypothetical protein